MNEVERIVRERAQAYILWMSKANTVAGTLTRQDTPEAFNAFCSGWNAARQSDAALTESDA